MKITTTAYNDIIKTLGSITAEQGGIGIGKDGVITDFIHDKHAKVTGGTYTLNTTYLNPILKKAIKQGKSLMAIKHSHPIGYGELSPQDKAYFTSQFKNFPDLEKLYTPIIYSAKDGEFNFFPYAIYPDGRIEKVDLEIVPDNYQDYLSKDTAKTEAQPPQIIKEIVQSEGKVIVNVHPAQIEQIEPSVFIIEQKQSHPDSEDTPKEKETVIPNIYIVETQNTEPSFFSKVYHSLLIGFFLFVLVMLLILSSSIYQFFKTLFNT